VPGGDVATNLLTCRFAQGTCKASEQGFSVGLFRKIRHVVDLLRSTTRNLLVVSPAQGRAGDFGLYFSDTGSDDFVGRIV
jgi:hypothetical protein